MGGSGPTCLPTSSYFGQSGGDVAGLSIQENNSDCSRLVQHALVLRSSGHVQLNSTEFVHPAQSTHLAIQSDSTQESVKPKSACMAPRGSAIKEQGFSEAMAARIEDPQRRSTRSVYEAKWAILYKVVPQ